MKTQLAQLTANALTLTEPGQSAFSIALNLAHAIYADKRGARISRNEAVNLIQEGIESDRLHQSAALHAENAALRAALETAKLCLRDNRGPSIPEFKQIQAALAGKAVQS